LKNSRQLGFVKGSLIEKELGTSSIGNILSSKFGDITEVERMIEDDKIEIIPTANIRGVEFNENSAVFVTEGQDIDTYTLKTIIQRCKKGCKLIVEGDVIEQSDISRGESGMERMIEVFKGFDQFGVVKLKNNYRSQISELADKM
jgi:predicted ribonuclease YlaK